ncbi:hypothetical protein C8Q79DRAFT_924020 [Trametes meyenii]|nr:hypothetical protein C8Q79DRAFT_924020 [Trametes meyenii]
MPAPATLWSHSCLAGMLFHLALGVVVCGLVIALANRGRKGGGSDADKKRRSTQGAPDEPKSRVASSKVKVSPEEGLGAQPKLDLKAGNDATLSPRPVRETTEPPVNEAPRTAPVVGAQAQKEVDSQVKGATGPLFQVAIQPTTSQSSGGQPPVNQAHDSFSANSDPRSPITSSELPPRVASPFAPPQHGGPLDIHVPSPPLPPSDTPQSVVTTLVPPAAPLSSNAEPPASTIPSDTPSVPALATPTSTSTPPNSRQTRIPGRLATYNIPPARGRIPLSLDQAAFNLNAFADPAAAAGPNGIGSPPLSVIGSPTSPPPSDKGSASWFDLFSPQ